MCIFWIYASHNTNTNVVFLPIYSLFAIGLEKKPIIFIFEKNRDKITLIQHIFFRFRKCQLKKLKLQNTKCDLMNWRQTRANLCHIMWQSNVFSDLSFFSSSAYRSISFPNEWWWHEIFWLLYARGVWIKCENGLQQTHWCGVYVCVFAPVIVYVCLTHIFLGLLCRALLLLLSIILHCTQVQHTFYRSWFQPVKYIVIDRLAKHQFPGMKKSRLFIA